MSADVGQYRTEAIHARISPSEKLALYRLANKQGGLSGAVRYLIQQYASKNDRSANPSLVNEGGAPVSTNF